LPLADNEPPPSANSLLTDVKDSLKIGWAPLSSLQSMELSLTCEKEAVNNSKGDAYKKDLDDQLSSTRTLIYLANTFATLRTFRTYSISWGNRLSDI
jgi:hypothetical protein